MISIDNTVYEDDWNSVEVPFALGAAVDHHNETNHDMAGYGGHAECETCKMVWYDASAVVE